MREAWGKDKRCGTEGCTRAPPTREECVCGMEQRRNYAALKDAQINLIQEECVGDMGRRGSFAVVKDVRINLIQEECASGMGQR